MLISRATSEQRTWGVAAMAERKKPESKTLTDTRVARLKATGKLYRVWDDKVPGFHVQVTPAGDKSYRVQFQRKSGDKVAVPIGKTSVWSEEAARKKAEELRMDHDKGLDVRAKRKEELNASDLQALVARWRLDPTGKLKLKERTRASYESVLKNNILPSLGNRLVKDINRKDVRDFHAKVSQEHKTTANRAVAVLSNLLNFAQAIDWRDEGAANPCHEPPKNPEKTKDRILERAELAALDTALSALEKAETLGSAAADLIRFLVLSGLRTSEAMGLKFTDVSLDGGVMRFEEHKTAGKAGVKKLPLNSHLVTLIQRRAASQISAYLFPGWVENKPMVGLAKMWARVITEAKLKNVSPHDLRRTFYTTVVKLTMSFDVADILTGHSLPKIRATYGIAPEESPVVVNASQDAADWIVAAMAGKKVKAGVKVTKEEKGKKGTA